ncbi:CAP domain-containing protein [Natronoarchaeum mannanilyticum]|uniref:CAP domain-containing protein n=1 Tax=Natronoarchaeum mannanilyticum TaxID=926360 RepID=UPI0036233799
MTSDSTAVRLLAAPFRIAYRLVAALLSVVFGLLKLLLVAALFVAAAAFVLQAAGVGVDPGAVGLPSPLDDGAELAPGDPNESAYTDGSVEIDSETVERLVHEEVNERRTERGLEPLEWNPTVASVSRAHSKDMADREYFSHTNPDGQGPFDRYREVASGCRAYGENIALSWVGRPVETDSGAVETYESDEELAVALVGQWMNSTGHRENMLRERWESGGVGVYITEEGKVLATHNFCKGWGL